MEHSSLSKMSLVDIYSDLILEVKLLERNIFKIALIKKAWEGTLFIAIYYFPCIK